MDVTETDGTVYQITADDDQHSRLAADPGNAGRLVLRWSYEDVVSPPVGRWGFDLIVSHAAGDEVQASGVIEVLA